MVADLIPTLLEANNLILLIILVLLFITGYKLMKAVMDLFLIAIFSGLFLVALGYVGIGPELTVTQFILFMALGVACYMVYTTLATAKSAVELLWNIISWLGDLVGDILGALRDMTGSVVDGLQSVGGDDSGGSTSTTSSGSKEKMAILEEVDDDE